jgi:hypothetical protein
MNKSPKKPSTRPTRPSKDKLPAPSITVDKRGIVEGADPRSVARATALLESIARRKARITEDFYGLGDELRELRDKELYRKVYGFSSFDAFLEQRSVYSPTQARKLIAIVRGLSKKRALELGVEKAYAAVSLAKATPAADTADEIFDEGHKVGTKRPKDATVDDFEAAAKGARKRAKKSASEKLVTSVERARKKRRDAGLRALRAKLASAGISARPASKAGGVVIALSWTMVEKLAKAD